MTNVKRYALNFCDRLEECKEGYLVYYDDYKVLEEKYLALLQQGVVEQKTWIGVDEALPEKGVDVLVWEKYSSAPFVGWLDLYGEWVANKEFIGCRGDAIIVDAIEQEMVTHWMPLPKTPE